MSFPTKYKTMLDAYYTTRRIGCHESAEAMRRVMWSMYGIEPKDEARSQPPNLGNTEPRFRAAMRCEDSKQGSLNK